MHCFQTRTKCPFVLDAAHVLKSVEETRARAKAWATIVPKLVTMIQTLNTQNQHAYV